VDEEIEMAPLFPNCCENGRHLPDVAHVQRQEQLGSERAGERLGIGSRFLVQVGYRDARADIAQGPGAAIGDRLIVGDAGNEPDFAGEHLGLGLGDVKAH